MKSNVERWRGVAAWMGLVCLGLLQASSLSAQEPRLRATLGGHTGKIVGLAFSPDSKTLASASYDGTLKTWDMTTGKERATLGEYRGCLGYVAFSPDGKTLASAAIGSPGGFPDLGDVRLWDVATGKVRTTLKANIDGLFTGAVGEYVHSVAFSPDGKILASASYDKNVKLWDVATGKERVTLKGTQSVAFSPDGRMLASAGASIDVWDIATDK